MSAGGSDLFFGEIGVAYGRHQRPVFADWAVLQPMPAKPHRLDRGTGDPDCREEMATPAVDDDIATEGIAASAGDQCHGGDDGKHVPEKKGRSSHALTLRPAFSPAKAGLARRLVCRTSPAPFGDVGQRVSATWPEVVNRESQPGGVVNWSGSNRDRREVDAAPASPARSKRSAVHVNSVTEVLMISNASRRRNCRRTSVGTRRPSGGELLPGPVDPGRAPTVVGVPESPGGWQLDGPPQNARRAMR
jgi:hypothetical protein